MSNRLKSQINTQAMDVPWMSILKSIGFMMIYVDSINPLCFLTHASLETDMAVGYAFHQELLRSDAHVSALGLPGKEKYPRAHIAYAWLSARNLSWDLSAPSLFDTEPWTGGWPTFLKGAPIEFMDSAAMFYD